MEKSERTRKKKSSDRKREQSLYDNVAPEDLNLNLNIVEDSKYDDQDENAKKEREQYDTQKMNTVMSLVMRANIFDKITTVMISKNESCEPLPILNEAIALFEDDYRN
jgi:hypothetical protein